MEPVNQDNDTGYKARHHLAMVPLCVHRYTLIIIYVGTLNRKNFLVDFGEHGITHEHDSTYFIVPHLLSHLIYEDWLLGFPYTITVALGEHLVHAEHFVYDIIKKLITIAAISSPPVFSRSSLFCYFPFL